MVGGRSIVGSGRRGVDPNRAGLGGPWNAVECPVILASAAAPPAMAISPCALYTPGRALPASTFTLTYMYVNIESRGLVLDT